MARHIPRHALTFMAHTARHASKHGLKNAAGKAAAKANPALLIIEAAVSVADAVNSFYKLKNAKARRDGLKDYIPLESLRLKVERHKLVQQIRLAQEEIQQKVDIQQRVGELALVCGRVVKAAWDELHGIRSADIPDLQEFDVRLEQLEDAWSDFQRALYNFYEMSN